MFVWAMLWWIFAGHHDIHTFLPANTRVGAHAAFFALTALASSLAQSRLAWKEASWPGLALLPLLWFTAVVGFFGQANYLGHFGWLAWPFAIGVQIALMKKNDGTPAAMRAGWHVGTFLLIALIGAWDLHWLAGTEAAVHSAWSIAALLVVPAILVLAISSRSFDARWPVQGHEATYRRVAVSVVLLLMALWVVYANATHDGRSDPLPYLPLLNALDLGHLLAGACLAAAILANRRTNLPPIMQGGVVPLVAGLAFIWVNGILLRSLHHWAGVPYRFDAMMRSVLVQASLSIFWAAIALAVMLMATRLAKRAAWMTGAALMAVVVVKLFLVDLSHIGGLERIVSFIAVGILMLVIGYFSPVPPRRTEERAQAEVEA